MLFHYLEFDIVFILVNRIWSYFEHVNTNMQTLLYKKICSFVWYTVKLRFYKQNHFLVTTYVHLIIQKLYLQTQTSWYVKNSSQLYNTFDE